MFNVGVDMASTEQPAELFMIGVIPMGVCRVAEGFQRGVWRPADPMVFPVTGMDGMPDLPVHVHSIRV